ncbi:TlpA disulfide reductase family protein [Thermodesulfobacteriota bacterium]
MKLKYLFSALILLLVLMACKQSDPDNRSGLYPTIGERMKMAPFEMISLTDKKTLNSKQFEGQVLLVTFFATWCPPCIQEIPTLKALQDTFKAKGFSVLAFSVDEGDVDPLVNLIDKYDINYPVFLEDPVVTKSFGRVTGIPVTFLVNRKGEIVKKYLGYVGYDLLEKAVGNMLTAG